MKYLSNRFSRFKLRKFVNGCYCVEPGHLLNTGPSFLNRTDGDVVIYPVRRLLRALCAKLLVYLKDRAVITVGS